MRATRAPPRIIWLDATVSASQSPAQGVAAVGVAAISTASFLPRVLLRQSLQPFTAVPSLRFIVPVVFLVSSSSSDFVPGSNFIVTLATKFLRQVSIAVKRRLGYQLGPQADVAPLAHAFDSPQADMVVHVAIKADHSTNYSLELSLGMPSTSSTTTTSSRATRKAWTVDPLPETRLHNGFIHPWSLAARQQKAVLEQSAPHKHNQYSSTPPSSSSSSSSSSLFLPRSCILNLYTKYLIHIFLHFNVHIRVDASSLIPVIGWPPVHAHRKNTLDRTLSSLKVVHETKENRNNVKRSKIKMDRVNDRVRSMFVKVKMEGYGIGRKVDLKAHDGYRSLSHALRKLFHNFLPVNYLEKSDEQSEEAFNDDFILLYQDIEGDQMLVGDIPWESFITSVEKLFIVQNPKKARCS
ncbi:hypothetical protein ZIOFF_006136 [Zingiber officinale]|uniref:Auxin-responsive protein n=1 Tax=Zingiber officinale TaxID=94328 RepID=A0A8J5I2B1_ZINOF|nr:hypothetical protein ZIOFF_006136 [Zingiber officinale]